ncbi:hypothetical protein [Planktotalea sp.]|uniref:hypothetical protein n=1 Tax=Planktotalea sp. TaxID=2029877 RepID=UPI003D6B42EE
MKTIPTTSALLLSTFVVAGCMPGTAIMEGMQGKESVAASQTLMVDGFMRSSCRTLSLQERSLRGPVTNPLANIAGGGIYGQQYKAIKIAMKRKGCAS